MLELENIILNSIKTLIKNSTDSKKLDKIKEKHLVKLHFIPLKYRVFGGILQSMNIQFGNFIEELMKELVLQSGYEILDMSGKKSNDFKISSFADSLVDSYITAAQDKINFNSSDEFKTLKRANFAR